MTDRRHATLAQDTPEAMLKMVLDREAATAARHDDRITALEAERDALAAVLEGAEYRIEAGFLEQFGVDGGRLLGQEVAKETKRIIAERDALAEKLAKAVEVLTRWSDKYTLALITPDAQAALDRVVGDLQAEIDFLHAQLEAWHEMAPPPEKGLLRKRLEERRAAIRKGDTP